MRRRPESKADPQHTPQPAPDVSRRRFLGSCGAVTAAGLLSLAASSPPPIPQEDCDELGPGGPRKRKRRCTKVRTSAAKQQAKGSLAEHCSNGDEAYEGRIASFSKGLPHDRFGHVDPAAYDSLLAALESGEPAAFEAIATSAPGDPGQRRLVNPQAGLAFDLQGKDAHALSQPPAPPFDSPWQAAELVENYWMALLRDVHFSDWAGDGDVAAAAAELSGLAGYRGPTVKGVVTPQTLFRDDLPGALSGPYLSQFLWRPVPFGAQRVEQRMRTLLPGLDHVTSHDAWLAVQNGVAPPADAAAFDPVARHIRNGRDLAQWVHVDVLYQAYFLAALILMTPPDPKDPFTGGGLGAPLNPGNPYLTSLTQEGFGTLGNPHITALLAEVSTRALKAVWYQKWYVHRRLRPEVFAGRVEHHLHSAMPYPIHADVLGSTALDEVLRKNGGTAFLPQAFPEGSPLHPSYGAGHATVAGACVTVLKWFFDESSVIENPVVPDADGTALLPYRGADAGALTVGGELDKLASNVATGRNIAGVHWRTDGIESLRLGEAVAIALLRDQQTTFNEEFACSFTAFDGSTVTI